MASHQLFRYPPMERQDLNQSQLGSFKFTPVDSVNTMQSLTRTAGQILQQQFSQRQRALKASTSSAGLLQDNGSTLSSGRAPPQLMSSGDTNYFNKHIKPDLGDSRLRLGPAALRTAVDGGSPAKKYTFMEADHNVNHHRPNTFVNAPQGVSNQLCASTMDPTAAVFLPIPNPFSAGIPDSASVGKTLCNALANEQRAHANEQRAHGATKAALAQQVTTCAEQTEQLKAYERKITHLETVINNLGAIVKHNASRQNSDDKDSNKETGYSEDAADPALNEFYREIRKLNKTEKKERTEEEQVAHADPLQDKDPAKQNAAGTVAAAAANEVVDDALLYDLDLLQKPDAGDSADSVLRRTLRKHFSIESSADDKPLETPSKKRGSLSNLIDISPEPVDGVEDIMRAQTTASVNSDNEGLTPTRIRLLSATDPTANSADLNACVCHQADVTDYCQSEETVTKYDNKSAPAPLKQKLNLADLEMEHLRRLESLRVGPDDAVRPPQDENYGRLTPISSIFDGNAQSPIAVVSSNGHATRDRIIFKIDGDLHGVTKWQINKDNPIFEDDREKWESVSINGPGFRNSSQFFDYPVRYLPEDAAATVNAYRTVMIDGIPDGSTMTDVLCIVKGGSLESIQLFPPIGNSIPYMTARVVFLFEQSAHNMIKHQEANPGQDADVNRFKIRGTKVRCWMPTDPTYPRNATIDREIFGDMRATRIVVIGNVDEYTFNMIPYRIKAPDDQHIIEYSYTAEGHAELEFSDIKTAIKVKNELEAGEGLWGGKRIQYGDDYTSVPYVHGEPIDN